MDERPRPDIDHTRDALRRHDERLAEDEETEEEVAEEKAREQDEDDED